VSEESKALSEIVYQLKEHNRKFSGFAWDFKILVEDLGKIKKTMIGLSVSCDQLVSGLKDKPIDPCESDT